MAPKWHSLGVHLKVSHDKLQGFNGGDGMTERCFTAVLAAWLSGEGNCSVSQLMYALKMPGVNQGKLAMEIDQNRSDKNMFRMLFELFFFKGTTH